MIVVLTKKRHEGKIREFLGRAYICTAEDGEVWTPPPDYTLGVSYCWPWLVPPYVLSWPAHGWINYHPAPLPEYKGPRETLKAIQDKVLEWGVSVHVMDRTFDTGPLIECRRFPLWEPPTSTAELGAVAHWHLFKLFRDTIHSLSRD